ncbi:MAG: hypothetical protein R3E98_17435 [Gemmatimonadota bacterium]|nr:hypothetical protein [Gemmatimonadota bacterium]
MDNAQLRAVMIYQLGAFSAPGVVVDDNTVHKDVLTDEGVGTATPKRIYKAFVRATFVMNGLEDPEWPADWMDLTVAELAAVLLPPGDA